MSVHQSQHHHHEQSLTLAQQRSQEFFEFFFTQQLWEYKGTDSNQNFGKVDIYHMKDHQWQKITNEKQHQYDHRSHGHHAHASHEILSEYRNSHTQNLPKWLPYRVAVKTTQVTQFVSENLRTQIDTNLDRFWSNSNEISKVFGYQQNGSELKIYFEYPNCTLEQDIRERRSQNRPFQEELLWKLMFNLVRASSRLGQVNQACTDIRPSRVYYNQYQVSVHAYGVAQERDGQLVSKYQAGEPVFFSNEILPDFNRGTSSSLRQSQQFRSIQSNESFQIGMTVLCAGLLKTETEVGVNSNKQFNHQRLDELLEDFGRIYSTEGKLLQFVLEELFLRPSRQAPSAIMSILRQDEVHFLFLENEFRHHLKHYFSTNSMLSHKRVDFEREHPHAHVSTEFWHRYPAHFYYDIRKLEFDSQMTRSQHHQHSTVQNTIVRSSGHYSQHSGKGSTIIQSSHPQHSHTIVQSTQPQHSHTIVQSTQPQHSHYTQSGHISSSVIRSSQQHHH